ncbi:hypothetical protein PVAP13_6NG198303 [Panicum virgatum]|uniref:Uncharacterized protein n=1 Tax=Panicum virgatum TaxID=38727 RepID=A0A8T0QX89_PANVG|nr:hypothetical protein PVAP13_6NG198303 [Panicum virgatum]
MTAAAGLLPRIFSSIVLSPSITRQQPWLWGSEGLVSPTALAGRAACRWGQMVRCCSASDAGCCLAAATSAVLGRAAGVLGSLRRKRVSVLGSGLCAYSLPHSLPSSPLRPPASSIRSIKQILYKRRPNHFIRTSRLRTILFLKKHDIFCFFSIRITSNR